MKRGRILYWVFLTFLAVILLVSFQHALSQESAEELYEAAVFKKESDGDLNGAIQILLKIVRDFPTDKKIAGKAQLQIGMCYEKLGKEEAIKAYELVLRNYSDQPDLITTARARLAELRAHKKEEQSLSRIYSRADDGYLLENQSLSPDGTKLLGINIGEGPGQNVAYKDLVTGELVYITYFDWESEGHGYTYNAVWSPDGKQVAFTFDGWKDPLQEVWISDLKGKSKSIFQCEAKDDMIYPVEWFPEARKILAIHIIQKKLIRLGILSVHDRTFSLLYEIAVQKGTKLNPNADYIIKADLSPDGKHVVFHEHKDKEGIGNIYVLDLAGKSVKPLMDSVTNNNQPCWSPDGKHIAFMSDRSGTFAVWAIPMKKDGNPDGQPFFLREGRYNRLINWTQKGLCLMSWMNMVDVFIMPVDPQTGEPTGKPRQLEFRPTGRSTYPVWSPDGEQLAFLSNLNDKWGELYVVIYPLSGGEVRKFKAPSTRGDRIVPRVADLRWLPDGSGISYSGNSPQTPIGSNDIVDFKMYVLKFDSGEWNSWDLKLDANISHTDWRGDGKGIYYSRYPQGQRDFKFDRGIVERDLTTGDERYIYRPEKNFGSAGIRCSRDFSKLAFHQILNGPLVVIDIKSGEKLNEFKDPGFPAPPTWSPDGKKLMIWNHDKLFVLSVEDGSRNGYDVDPGVAPINRIRVLDWSPDGTKVAFAGMNKKFESHLLRNVIPKK
ncbi:MAG: tetratricopeptide repeat protein [Candidatus Aminicenantaceae bacterium]